MNPPGASRRSSFALLCGLLLSSLFLIAAFGAPWLAPYPPNAVQPEARMMPPSTAHLCGTDSFGRDQFSRLLFGARADLWLVSLAVLTAAVPGTALGIAAGIRSGWLDFLLSRLTEIWLSLPALLIAIVVVTRFGASVTLLGLALGVAGLPSFFRLGRNATLSLKKKPFVEAARALGAGEFWLTRTHILPNLISPLLILISLRMSAILLAGSGLSFIGLGAQSPQAEWGAMLADGKNALAYAWWLAFFPGIALTLTAWGFQLLGDGLRDHYSVIRH